MNTAILSTTATTIRGLAIDAIEAANSGHPGLPLGCAELGAYLYGQFLRHDPSQPNWINRDRLILSAGHGSMWLYACLHLAGFGVSLDQIKSFRQFHSPTAGHPEYKELPGIETTTGPLGQGVATAVGMALSQKMAAAQFELAPLMDGQVVVLAGDGCMMEGISSEASSFAGHLKLNNLILVYDANHICLDGPITECFTEDVAARYEAYGWKVWTVNGHEFSEIDRAMTEARAYQGGPSLIIAHTIIGKGSPSFAGSSEVHGKALGKEEATKAKAAMGIPEGTSFYVPQEVTAFFESKRNEQKNASAQWAATFETWKEKHPHLAEKLAAVQTNPLPVSLKTGLAELALKEGAATRVLSGEILQYLHDHAPQIVGGSADLSCSDNTWMKNGGMVAPQEFNARNIKFGVREFAMAAMCNGIVLDGFFRPYCGTFLTFSDYMKNAIRLAALMQLPVIYQFTHDSIFLGEDGPTHQPVEHLASLRSIPQLTVIRPADANEVKGAWLAALSGTTPTALILSRQGLPTLTNSQIEGVSKGAYILKKEHFPAFKIGIIATGSEVGLALEVAKKLEERQLSVRVVSMPSFELFDAQSTAYQAEILPEDVSLWVSIEAQSSFGWHKYIGKSGLAISIDQFGLSAPAKDLAKAFGFEATAIVEKILHRLQ